MSATRIKRPEARVLAEEEFVRFADLVASLTPDEWARPTDCTRATERALPKPLAAGICARRQATLFPSRTRTAVPGAGGAVLPGALAA